jgi:nucleotide-binding universal stress UspA family protein
MTLRMEGVLGLGDDRRIGAVVADESSKAAAPVRVESLLVAVDAAGEAGHAAARAAALARELGASKLHLVHASRRRGNGASHVGEKLLQVRLEALALDLALPASLRTRCVVASGPAARVIAEASPASVLTVIGAPASPIARHWPRASLASRVLAHRRAPVLVVRRPCSGPYRRVLVAADLTTRSEDALHWARLVAPSARIEVVHALDVPFEGKMRFAGVEDHVIADYRRSALRRAIFAMEALVPRPRPAKVTTRIVSGRAAWPILDRMRETGADLVVAAPSTKGRVERWFLPSVTDRLIGESPADVLAVPE